MDFIKDILEEKGADLLGALTDKAGFSSEQATAFLPEAGQSVAATMAAKSDDLDFADLASSANVGTILGGLDVAALAGRTGLSGDQGKQGLMAILPMLLGFVSEKGDAAGLLGLLGKAQGLGDALGGIKGLGGKLFG